MHPLEARLGRGGGCRIGVRLGWMLDRYSADTTARRLMWDPPDSVDRDRLLQTV